MRSFGRTQPEMTPGAARRVRRLTRTRPAVANLSRHRGRGHGGCLPRMVEEVTGPPHGNEQPSMEGDHHWYTAHGHRTGSDIVRSSLSAVRFIYRSAINHGSRGGATLAVSSRFAPIVFTIASLSVPPTAIGALSPWPRSIGRPSFRMKDRGECNRPGSAYSS